MKSSAWSRSSLIVCLLMAVSLSGLFTQQAHTQSVFSQAQVQAVLQAEASLNRISTAAGRFLQISNEGGIARGDFFLSRPGRFRFDYDAPSPLALIANGRNIIEIDMDLQSARRKALNATPLRLFLSSNVDFRNTADIEQVETISDSLLITMRDRGRPNDGTLTLVVDAANFTLRAWQIVDNKGERTTVRLENMTYGISIPPQYFTDPGY